MVCTLQRKLKQSKVSPEYSYLFLEKKGQIMLNFQWAGFSLLKIWVLPLEFCRTYCYSDLLMLIEVHRGFSRVKVEENLKDFFYSEQFDPISLTKCIRLIFGDTFKNSRNQQKWATQLEGLIWKHYVHLFCCLLYYNSSNSRIFIFTSVICVISLFVRVLEELTDQALPNTFRVLHEITDYIVWHWSSHTIRNKLKARMKLMFINIILLSTGPVKITFYLL